jgi:dipeptidyl aminopeptidase/acylaminoacyl peptidase
MTFRTAPINWSRKMPRNLADGSHRAFIRSRGAFLLGTLFVASVPDTAAARQAEPAAPVEVYRTPPPEMAALVDQPQTPSASLSPGGETLLLGEVPPTLTIEDVARPELRIAGVRIDPANNGPSRSGYVRSLTLLDVATGAEREVTGLPESPRLRNLNWSPDGSRFAFTLDRPERIELWTASVGDAAAARVGELALNDAVGSPYEWLPDGSGFVARLVPEDRAEPPVEPGVPSGPVIQETAGRRAAARTYQDLLESPHDAALFEHYLATTVAYVGLDGSVTPAGPEGLVVSAEPSPDGRYLLTETRHRPFSYLVPYYRFPNRIEVWDRDGNVVHMVADLPLQEEVPIAFDGVATGVRSVQWRADAPAALAWVEARDGGDPDVEAEIRDEVLTLAAPFEAEPATLAELGLRYAGLRWGTDEIALVDARWWNDRTIHTWRLAPGTPGEGADGDPQLLWDRSWEDRYGDPGSPMMRTNEAGRSVMLIHEGALLLGALGASPEGNRPFIDRFDLATAETERLWRSEAPYFEYPVDVLDAGGGMLLTQRESQTGPPNYYVRDIAGDDAGTLVALTDFPHPTPELADVRKELIVYERADGVQLTATLYLPPGYEEGDGPLPVLMWAYPREFKDPELAGQVTDSPHRFVRVSYWAALPMLTQGWAVLDNPSMPIIGEGDTEPNDDYREQLVASAEAAVEEMVRRGIGERGKMAIGGHSYGAFMVGNLLAHSDLYAAGIARSGAYNRSLTPFGFQAEQRTFWEAPEVYFAMSPFMNAADIDEPILMIHGAEDNNSGTFPIQSERMYHALKGLGATTRLVMLPEESHGYRARESLLHMLWEQNEWLKRWVSPGAEEAERATTD